jgi:hypothetical protein
MGRLAAPVMVCSPRPVLSNDIILLIKERFLIGGKQKQLTTRRFLSPTLVL